MRVVLVVSALLAVLASAKTASSKKKAVKKNYIETGPCKYCVYAQFCSECKSCPCTSRGPDDLPFCEYCPYCKYCAAASLCEYCEEGSVLSSVAHTVSGWVSAVGDALPIGKQKSAEKTMTDFEKEKDDPKLSKEKLKKVNKKVFGKEEL